jgi:hypothetical protein
LHEVNSDFGFVFDVLNVSAYAEGQPVDAKHQIQDVFLNIHWLRQLNLTTFQTQVQDLGAVTRRGFWQVNLSMATALETRIMALLLARVQRFFLYRRSERTPFTPRQWHIASLAAHYFCSGGAVAKLL